MTATYVSIAQAAPGSIPAEVAAQYLTHEDSHLKALARSCLEQMVRTWNYYFNSAAEGYSRTDHPSNFPPMVGRDITGMGTGDLRSLIRALEVDKQNLERMERVLVSALGRGSEDPLLVEVRERQLAVGQKIVQAKSSLAALPAPKPLQTGQVGRGTTLERLRR